MQTNFLLFSLSSQLLKCKNVTLVNQVFRTRLVLRKLQSNANTLSLYRTSGVIFFIDYCTAIRDT